ncbi:uncharacterized protein LOC110442698 [Mizuhopecten yessoensis]|uniref:Ankyrin repeat protein n=1 Tax=Mizuhopecten yessoensis TaxID=6573 RepID=A0A210PGR8_MIZYE|nr:uncharacterized protein LOC110442698 [Mizuhopecten yessoensis]OWF35636.1 Ankyrin repeat protein [Mizuhopecten yessoensis]
MTEVAPQPEDGRDLKGALLFSLRDNKPKEAIKLLKEGAGVDFQDQTGCLPLHYAAQKGYTDIIELLLEKGAKTYAWDNNGQTALHRAAMQGHVLAIVTLVARGARVDIIDRTGRLALEYAVRNKHVAAVELLCQFGSEPLLLDWSWIQDRDLKKKADLFAIAKILKQQLMCMSGYKHGAIRFDVAVIAPGEVLVTLEKTGVDVKVPEGQGLYVLYLSQTEEAYGNPPTLDTEEKAFGHLLECQTWGAKNKTITLTLTVHRALRKNEEVVLRPATKTGGIDNVEAVEIEGTEVTKVTLTVPITSSGIYRFAMATREKKEVLKISNEAVILKPDVEPEAEIDIPANTFKSGELLIKFVDTSEANEEFKESEEAGQSSEGPLLMTSVLDLTTTDGQQPSNDIQMKIPVKTEDQSEGFVVLTTSDPDPNLDEWTWESIPAEIDGAGKAVFTISHFSIFAGAAKMKVIEDKKSVEGAIRQSYLKMRKIHFLVMVNKPQPNTTKTDMIIICGTQRKTKLARKKLKRTYECFDSGKDLFEVPEGQCFQVLFQGAVKETTSDENMTILFKSSDTASTRSFDIMSTDADIHELNGSVEILTVNKFYSEVEEVRPVGSLCFKSMKTVKVKSKDYDTRTASMVTVPFNVRLARLDSVDEDDESNTMDEFERKDKCIIPALKWKNLRETMKELSTEEALQLGSQLGIKADVMNEIREQTSDTDLAFAFIRKWRLKLPGSHQADQLKNALIAIGKERIAERMSSQGLEEQRDKGGDTSEDEE